MQALVPSFLVLGPEKDGLAHYARTLEQENLPAAAGTLAHAIATSNAWQHFPDVVLVIRKTKEPVLALLGRFDSHLGAVVSAQVRAMQRICADLRYISYAQAELDCKQLAANLVEALPPDLLNKARFVGIPRGGLIVLGMMAYWLGLKAEQLGPSTSADELLIVVDDCSLSGARYHGFLQRVENEKVIFCTLYSHPDLRQEIERREKRVQACISAHDLTDYAPANMGDGYTAWRQRWQQELGEAYYWIGQTEHICFAWNEPDHNVRDPNGKIIPGWNILPPEKCLKNSTRNDYSAERIQVQPPGKGPLLPAKEIIFGQFEGQWVIGNLQTGQSFGLAGIAGDIWQAVIRHGTRQGVLDELTPEYDVEKERLERDVLAFIDTMLKQGLLEVCQSE